MTTVQILASSCLVFWFITLIINSLLWINTRQPLREERMALPWGIHFGGGAWLCIFSAMVASPNNLVWHGADAPGAIDAEIALLALLVLATGFILLLNYWHRRQKYPCS